MMRQAGFIDDIRPLNHKMHLVLQPKQHEVHEAGGNQFHACGWLLWLARSNLIYVVSDAQLVSPARQIIYVIHSIFKARSFFKAR